MSLSLFSSLDAFRAYFRKCFEQKINDLLIGFRVIKHCFRLGSDNEDDEDDQGFESRAKHDAKDDWNVSDLVSEGTEDLCEDPVLTKATLIDQDSGEVYQVSVLMRILAWEIYYQKSNFPIIVLHILVQDFFLFTPHSRMVIHTSLHVVPFLIFTLGNNFI